MARAGYANVVADSFGNRLAGASVEVRQPGTAAKVAGALYAGPTGAATLSNPLTASNLGHFAFYRDTPETVDLFVAVPGYQALTVGGVAVALDAPVLDGSLLVADSVTTAQIADGTLTDADVAVANKDGSTETPSLRTLGTGAQQAAAGNHGHTHASLAGVGANDHHAQVHALSGGDHSGTLALSQYRSVPAARAYHNASQSVAHATLTVLALNSERWDTDTMHDPATNNSRLTVKTAGWYVVTAAAEFAANATGIRQLKVLLNGATPIAVLSQPASTGGNFTRQVVVTAYFFAVTDWVEMEVFQDSGGALNVNSTAQYSPELTMVWVGP
jgi:hypothetical protein